MRAVVARAKTKGSGDPLDSVYHEVVAMMKRYAPPFRTDVRCAIPGKKSFQLTVPRPVVVPGSYGGKPVDVAMASAIIQKDFVGFYLTCVYMDEAAQENLSPALLKLRKGKSCFHLKKLDHGLRKDIDAALGLGTGAFRERGWV
jgi:hypothetical protein